MSTDEAWRRWGEQDPYFAVLTHPRYRLANLDDAARQAFFETGEAHARYLIAQWRRLVGGSGSPRRALDFGSGVGRVAIPLAREVELVVGVDIAPAMLREAERNAERFGRGNLQWVLSDDTLSGVQGPFDLIHSCITFQHIDVPRGRALFARLLELLAEGGMAAVHLTYAKAWHASRWGQPPEAVPRWPQQPGNAAPDQDPEMQMNAYHLGELAFLMQTAGVREFQASFTDHGGELGVFLFFRKPPSAA